MAKKGKKYSLFLISNKPHLYQEVIRNLKNETVTFFDGSGVNSFSELVNKCVESSNTEIVILMSDKTRPTNNNVEKTIDLINQGYAFVGLYRFGFFGFKKELFRIIGPLDERFIGGCFEDDDFYIRLCEANLSMYLSQEVNYIRNVSSWNHSLSKKHFFNKWGTKENKIYRKLLEPELNYNFGKRVPCEFLPWHYSKFLAKKIKKYQTLEITYE